MEIPLVIEIPKSLVQYHPGKTSSNRLLVCILLSGCFFNVAMKSNCILSYLFSKISAIFKRILIRFMQFNGVFYLFVDSFSRLAFPIIFQIRILLST